MMLEEIINNIPDTFYDNLCSVLHHGKLHTPKSLNESLREIDEILEKRYNLQFPCSKTVREQSGEVFYNSSIVKQKVYREHVIGVNKRMIECRKRILIHHETKLEIYQYLKDTLYLVYKDYSEKLEEMESEVYIRDSEKRNDIIEYFNNSKK